MSDLNQICGVAYGVLVTGKISAESTINNNTFGGIRSDNGAFGILVINSMEGQMQDNKFKLITGANAYGFYQFQQGTFTTANVTGNSFILNGTTDSVGVSLSKDFNFPSGEDISQMLGTLKSNNTFKDNAGN